MLNLFARCTAIMLLVIAANSPVSAQNLLGDPGFELSDSTNLSNPFWILDANLPDGVNPSAFFQNAPWASNPNGEEGVGVWLRAFEGNQAGGGDPLADVSLYQDVAAPAGDYELSFFFKRETNFTAASTKVELLEDGVSIGLVDLTDTPATGVFEPFSLSASSNGGTLRVLASMTGGVDAIANPQSAMFDDFALTQVPEPSSLVLALAGLLGLALRRR